MYNAWASLFYAQRKKNGRDGGGWGYIIHTYIHRQVTTPHTYKQQEAHALFPPVALHIGFLPKKAKAVRNS